MFGPHWKLPIWNPFMLYPLETSITKDLKKNQLTEKHEKMF